MRWLWRFKNNRPVSVILLQAVMVVFFALLLCGLSGRNQGWSSMAGGMISLAGGLAYVMVIGSKKTDAALIVRAHFRAEALKMLVVAILFVAVFLLFPLINQLWLIVGFAIASLSYWFALLLI